MEAIKENYGCETKIVEMGSDATKYEPTITEYSESGDWDVIILCTNTLKEILQEIAQDLSLIHIYHDGEEGHDHHHGHGCCGHDHDHHHADEVFTSWGMETIVPVTHDQLEDILKRLAHTEEFGQVLRAKGMLCLLYTSIPATM